MKLPAPHRQMGVFSIPLPPCRPGTVKKRDRALISLRLQARYRLSAPKNNQINISGGPGNESIPIAFPCKFSECRMTATPANRILPIFFKGRGLAVMRR
jgi:hypothetical protein